MAFGGTFMRAGNALSTSSVVSRLHNSRHLDDVHRLTVVA
jgi:hypothetical protein